MKYKVGDKVRIHSKEWYDKHKDECGNIRGAFFDKEKARLCGTIQTIASAAYVCGSGIIIYSIEDAYEFIGEEAIEGLAELTDERLMEIARDACRKVDEEMDLRSRKSRKFYDGEQWSIDYVEFKCLDGYTFKDENGNVIDVKKIVLEKKKKKYPKTYEECCEVLRFKPIHSLALQLIVTSGFSIKDTLLTQYERELTIKLEKFRKLLICRDAYWKIAGEEMGLGKPWKPDYDSGVDKFGIVYFDNTIMKTCAIARWERHLNKILEFPTEEMRDAFKGCFDSDIEICKELL